MKPARTDLCCSVVVQKLQLMFVLAVKNKDSIPNASGCKHSRMAKLGIQPPFIIHVPVNPLEL